MSGKNGTVFDYSGDFANALRDENDFVRVAPYGDAPQFDKDGKPVVQRFDFESALAICDAFRRGKAKLLSRLGFANASIPFYNGHPDFADNGGEARDSSVYAEAYDLEARTDGLYAKIRRIGNLLDALKEKLGALQISPRWLCKEDGANSGIMKPFELISFGLVKKGNLPNADFINSTKKGKITMDAEKMKQLAVLVGLAETATDDEILAAVSEIVKRNKGVDDMENECGKMKCERDKAMKERDDMENVCKRKDKELSDAENVCKRKDKELEAQKKELDAANAALKEREHDLSARILDDAANEGKLTPEMRKGFEKAFESDFANTAKTISALPKIIDAANKGGDPKVIDDAAKIAQKSAQKQKARAEFAEMVNAVQKEHPERSYSDCVAEVAASNRGRELVSACEF